MAGAPVNCICVRVSKHEWGVWAKAGLGVDGRSGLSHAFDSSLLLTLRSLLPACLLAGLAGWLLALVGLTRARSPRRRALLVLDDDDRR